MKKSVLTLLVVALSTFVAGQQTYSERSSAKSDKTEKSVAVTVTGCLARNEHNRYTVGTNTGDLYILAGDDSVLRRLNGKVVQVTGTMEPTPSSGAQNENFGVLKNAPPTIKVTNVKKVADVCH